MRISTIELSSIHHTNRQRNRHGLRPLKSDKRLTRAARSHSSWMLRRRRLDQTDARQSEPHERARSAGFPTTYVGENIYMTTGGAACKTGVRQSRLQNRPKQRADLRKSGGLAVAHIIS